MEHIDYLYGLSVSAADKSDLPEWEKRNLLFALYSFRCLFDDAELLSPSTELVRNKCCFFAPVKDHPFLKQGLSSDVKDGDRLKEGGIISVRNGETFVKFDAGSEIWAELKAAGKLSGIAASLPEKPSLYKMALELITLSNASLELKSMWYIMFPFVIFLDAPYEPELFDALKSRLCREEIFEEALKSQRSVIVYDSTEEMRAEGISPLAIEWYTPYIEYKNARTASGITRECERYKRELALKNFAFVITGTEKLLCTFPFDEELTLVNIAARVSAFDAATCRDNFLNETLERIGEALSFCKERRAYLLYYAGLCKLGLKDTRRAEENFEACLKLDPSFELAAFMLKALREPEKWTGK